MKHTGLQQLRVECRNSIDCMASYRGQVRHTHRLLSISPVFIDKRESLYATLVAGKCLANVGKVAGIDLLDNLQVPGKERAKQAARPLLQRFRKKRVVCIRQGILRHVPRCIPIQQVLVHQQPHQFCNGDRRVRIVHLDGEVAMQLCQRPILSQLNAHNVLQAA